MSYFNHFLETILKEDLGTGDHSTLSCIPENAEGTAQLIVKDRGIIAGIQIARKIFSHVDKDLVFDPLLEDGANVKPGDIAFIATGKIHTLLQTERIVLNIMQRMSGIATTTNAYVKCLHGLKTKVLDTRKTTPGLRFLEKEAVRIGGGKNHRMGLYDMIMLKDNHIDFAGGIPQAITKAQEYIKKNNLHIKIEVEVRNLKELDEVLQTGGVDRLMLDNFSIETTKEAIKRIDGKLETESSGGITIDTLRAYGECGVDYISVGALTHSVKSFDLSFKAL